MRVSRERINAAATATYEHTVETLGKHCDSAACGAACRRLAGALDAEFAAARANGVALACAAGCSFCCRLRVSVFPHEAVALLHFLRTSMSPSRAAAIEAQILDNARKIDAMTPTEHHATNMPCALLLDGRCSAYAVRPSACAHHHSLSRVRCEHAFNHAPDAGTPRNSRPASLELQALGDALIEATQAGLAAAGLVSARGELHQQLRALIEDASLVDRACSRGNGSAASNDEGAGTAQL